MHLRTSTAALRSRHAFLGFTAIELMVVVAIVAILATIALPSFDRQIKRWQVNQTVDALTDTIYFARSEAVKLGGHVKIGKLGQSATDCSSTSNDWNNGWEVFTDIGGVCAILKQVQANGKSRVTSAPAVLDLNRWGNPSAGYRVDVQHTNHGEDAGLSQSLCLSSGGRLRHCP